MQDFDWTGLADQAVALGREHRTILRESVSVSIITEDTESPESPEVIRQRDRIAVPGEAPMIGEVIDRLPPDHPPTEPRRRHRADLRAVWVRRFARFPIAKIAGRTLGRSLETLVRTDLRNRFAPDGSSAPPRERPRFRPGHHHGPRRQGRQAPRRAAPALLGSPGSPPTSKHSKTAIAGIWIQAPGRSI